MPFTDASGQKFYTFNETADYMLAAHSLGAILLDVWKRERNFSKTACMPIAPLRGKILMQGNRVGNTPSLGNAMHHLFVRAFARTLPAVIAGQEDAIRGSAAPFLPLEPESLAPGPLTLEQAIELAITMGRLGIYDPVESALSSTRPLAERIETSRPQLRRIEAQLRSRAFAAHFDLTEPEPQYTGWCAHAKDYVTVADAEYAMFKKIFTQYNHLVQSYIGLAKTDGANQLAQRLGELGIAFGITERSLLDILYEWRKPIFMAGIVESIFDADPKLRLGKTFSDDLVRLLADVGAPGFPIHDASALAIREWKAEDVALLLEAASLQLAQFSVEEAVSLKVRTRALAEKFARHAEAIHKAEAAPHDFEDAAHQAASKQSRQEHVRMAQQLLASETAAQLLAEAEIFLETHGNAPCGLEIVSRLSPSSLYPPRQSRAYAMGRK